jgi:hypothetical protein
MGKIPAARPREQAAEGTHIAVCTSVIDLGTQASEQWGDRHKVSLGFELVEEKTSDGKAMVVYKQYTYTNSPKGNLMKDLKAWLGVKNGDFDMDNCLGKPASVTIEHSETDRGTFANITNIASLPKGTKVRKATEPLVSFYLDETFDEDVYNGLSEYLRNKIAASPEYAEIMEGAAAKKKPKKTAAAAPAKKGRGK